MTLCRFLRQPTTAWRQRLQPSIDNVGRPDRGNSLGDEYLTLEIWSQRALHRKVTWTVRHPHQLGHFGVIL